MKRIRHFEMIKWHWSLHLRQLLNTYSPHFWRESKLIHPFQNANCEWEQLPWRKKRMETLGFSNGRREWEIAGNFHVRPKESELKQHFDKARFFLRGSRKLKGIYDDKDVAIYGYLWESFRWNCKWIKETQLKMIWRIQVDIIINRDLN